MDAHNNVSHLQDDFSLISYSAVCLQVHYSYNCTYSVKAMNEPVYLSIYLCVYIPAFKQRSATSCWRTILTCAQVQFATLKLLRCEDGATEA